MYSNHHHLLESAAKFSEESCSQSTILEKDSIQEDVDKEVDVIKHVNEDVYEDEEEEGEEEEEEEEEEGEEEFSFMWGEGKTSPIAAEDAFMDGQIKPIYPLFDMDLLVGEEGGLPVKPQVKKVFVELENNDHHDEHQKITSASSENDEVVGPYCHWSSKKAAPSSSESCKKSNSTGFSKLWRFKDQLRHRSNSDGRDAFVFLNHHAKTTTTSSQASGVEVKVDGGKVNDGKGKVKKGGKGKTPAKLSAHEIYMRNKAKEGERHRSYLPYRPEVFGFFTNVNGGMSKNLHPF